MTRRQGYGAIHVRAALVVLCVSLACAPQRATCALGDSSGPYDGKLRKTGDGRTVAYMIPPYTTNHASFLILQPDTREWIMAWFSGTVEGANDVAIVLARLEDGSDQWTNASVTSRRNGYSNQNPVLFYATDSGALHLFHSQQPANKGEDNATVWHLVSYDGRGLPGNWTPPREVFGKPGSFTRNRLILSLQKDWILPMYYARGPAVDQYAHIKTSRTQGQGLWGNMNYNDVDYLVQPSCIRPVPGSPHLITYFRDRRSQHIYRADSQDDGVTWTPAQATQFPNNNAGIEANVLANGHLVLCYNPLTENRNKIAIALSEDGGKTWPYSRLMEDSPNEADEFSYPTVLQDPFDLSIHVSYTYLRQSIKYTVMDESWIKGGGAV